MDTVRMEHAFAKFFGVQAGKRGKFYDADILSDLDSKELGTLIDRVAKRLSTRVKSVSFDPFDKLSGGTHDRLEVAALELSRTAKRMRKQPKGARVRDRVRLDILAAAVLALGAAMDELEWKSLILIECRKILEPRRQ